MDLYPFQVTGAQWLAERETALLADAMGCGKSAQAIVACDHVRARNILLIVPGIARANWEREINQWSMYKRQIGIVHTTAKGVPDTEVVIASYSILTSLPILKKLLAREWDVLICDEAHYLKNNKAKRTRCVYGAKCDRTKGLASQSKRVWLLTGTPIPNNLAEVWPHARALFPHAVMGYEKYQAWVDHFCVVNDTYGTKVIANKNVQDFVKRMQPYTLRRRLEDVMPQMPEIRFAQVVVEPETLPPMSQEMKDTDAIIKTAIAQRLQEAGRENELTEEDLRAIEYSAGMHLASTRKWTGVAKAHAVAQLVKEDFASGMDKVVIFALHREVFRILLELLPGSKAIHGGTPMAERDKLIDMFQGRIANEKLDILLVHIDIGSTALTLTASCNVVFAETTWVPKDVQQAAKRCHRIGQTRPVLARIVSLRDSIDESVGSVLTRKSASISRVETALTTGAQA